MFNASAARLPDFGPSSARLYSPQPWCLPENQTDENQFLEVNLPGIFSLSAVATVGGNLGYVTSYMLSYMVSEYMWKYASVEKQEVWAFENIGLAWKCTKLGVQKGKKAKTEESYRKVATAFNSRWKYLKTVIW